MAAPVGQAWNRWGNFFHNVCSTSLGLAGILKCVPSSFLLRSSRYEQHWLWSQTAWDFSFFWLSSESGSYLQQQLSLSWFLLKENPVSLVCTLLPTDLDKADDWPFWDSREAPGEPRSSQSQGSFGPWASWACCQALSGLISFCSNLISFLGSEFLSSDTGYRGSWRVVSTTQVVERQNRTLKMECLGLDPSLDTCQLYDLGQPT